jgi:hypothetical protein
MTLDAANATIKTEGHAHHKNHQHKKQNDKSSKNTKNSKRIQFDESAETPEELQNLTQEEIRSRRKDANIIALIKKATTKSQVSILED